MSIRPPAVSGRFYPALRSELRDEVQAHLQAAIPAARTDAPVAVIGPHAGFAFSGPVAGSAFAMWRANSGRVQRVIVIGPSHHVAFEGIATSSHAAFRTPLGDAWVDTTCRDRALLHDVVHTFEPAHVPEHSIETHLPFLQEVLGQVPIVPLVTGLCDEAAVAEVLDDLWDVETLVSVSSDLSHFETHENATIHDAKTAARIVALDSEIGPRDACGAVAVRGLLAVARARGLDCDEVDLRNSGDTSGGRDRVVGYGAFGFWSKQ